MKSISLAEFVGFFDAQKAPAFRTDTIEKYLTEHSVSIDELASYVFFREDTYGRNMVSGNDNYEMLVLTWLPGQRTPIHDHAGQRCWMRVVTGELTFKNYLPLAGKKTLVPSGAAETHAASKTVYIDDSLAIHSIANASTKPAVSLHIYAGPVEKCQVYNETAKQFEWIDLAHFAPPKPVLDPSF